MGPGREKGQRVEKSWWRRNRVAAILQKALMAGILSCSFQFAEGVAEESEIGQGTVSRAYALHPNTSTSPVNFPLEEDFGIKFYSKSYSITGVKLMFSSNRTSNLQTLTINNGYVSYNSSNCSYHGLEFRLKYEEGALTLSGNDSTEGPCELKGFFLQDDTELQINNFGQHDYAVAFGYNEGCVKFSSELLNLTKNDFTRAWAEGKLGESSAVLDLCWRNTSFRGTCTQGHPEEYNMTFESDTPILLEVDKENDEYVLEKNGSLVARLNKQRLFPTETSGTYSVMTFSVKETKNVSWWLDNCTESEVRSSVHQTRTGEKEEDGEEEVQNSAISNRPEEERESEDEGDKEAIQQPTRNEDLGCSALLFWSGWITFGILLGLVLIFQLSLTAMRWAGRKNKNEKKKEEARNTLRDGEHLQLGGSSSAPFSQSTSRALPSAFPKTTDAGACAPKPLPGFQFVRKGPKKEEEEEEEHMYDYIDEAQIKALLTENPGPVSHFGGKTAAEGSPPLSRHESENSLYKYRLVLEAEGEVQGQGAESNSDEGSKL